jgi:hypothetical protein
MTVKELRDVLHAYPDGLPVVLSKDSEGNSFSPLADHDAGIYEPETKRSGHVYAEEDEVDASSAAFEACVLYPTN